jgi:hypothetical protein
VWLDPVQVAFSKVEAGSPQDRQVGPDVLRVLASIIDLYITPPDTVERLLEELRSSGSSRRPAEFPITMSMLRRRTEQHAV